MNFILFNSKNKNRYLKSYNKKSIMLSHPAFGLTEDDQIISGFNCNEQSHQKKKINYLKKHGFFKDICLKGRINGKLDAELVSSFTPQIDGIIFEMTEKCNLKCKYCIYEGIYNGRRKRKLKDIDFEVIKNVLDFFNNKLKTKKRTNSINVSFYGGEPLLSVDKIRKTIEYIKEINFNNLNVNYLMTTNGIFLWENIKFIVENDIELLISLDGDSKHNGNRVFRSNSNPCYKVIKKNIDLVKLNYPAFYKKNVSFNSVFHNLSNFDEILDFFEIELSKTTRLAPLDANNIDKNKLGDFEKLYQNLFDAYISSRHYSVLNINHNNYSLEYLSMGRFILSQKINFQFKNMYDYFYQPDKKLIPTGTCLPFLRKIFITSDGLILPCERVPHNHILGKVSTSKVKIDTTKIAEYYNNLYLTIIKQCKHCYNYENCGNCLFTNVRLNKCSKFVGKNLFADILRKNIDYIEQFPNSYVKSLKRVNYEE